MRDALFHLSRKPGVGLQVAVREMLLEALLNGVLLQGGALPSCRVLAQKLAVSRNTIAQAYQGLNEDGLIDSQPRRGFFVSSELDNNPLWRSLKERKSASADSEDNASWMLAHIAKPPSHLSFVKKPADWYAYKYPFVYGQVDSQLFPINAWRECSRRAMSAKNLEMWTGDVLSYDDPQLTHYIKSRLLSRRGIGVDDDNILVSAGSQNALYMLATLFANRNTRVGLENPGYTDVRHQFGLVSDNIVPLPLDSEGVILTGMEEGEGCRMVYTTPSYQYPTNITMSFARRKALLETARRHDIIILEDDYECESDYQNNPLPALKSMDEYGHVIYLGSLSKNLFPSLRLGYIVADASIIRELQVLRRLILRYVAMNNQRTAALFLGLGYHMSFYKLLHKVFARRRAIAERAIAEHLRPYICEGRFGLSSFWGRFKDFADSSTIAAVALKHSIIIESGGVFFMESSVDASLANSYFRLGFSSISEDMIGDGIALLASLCGDLSGGGYGGL